MNNFSSDSGLSDSEGFNDFLNGPDSSSDSIPMPRAYKKSNARPNTGDPYAYDIDFGNIKVPSKIQPKPVPKKQEKKAVARVKTPESEEESLEVRPKTTGSKFEQMQKEYKKMLKNVKKDSSDDLDSGSSSMASVPKPKHWGDVKQDYLDSSDSSAQLKTEPFKAKISQPISLNKKLEAPKEQLKDYPRPVAKDLPIKAQKDIVKEKPKISISPLESEFLNSSELGSEDDLYSSSNAYAKESGMYTGRSDQVIEEEDETDNQILSGRSQYSDDTGEKHYREEEDREEYGEGEGSEEGYVQDSQYEDLGSRAQEEYSRGYSENVSDKYTDNYSEAQKRNQSESKRLSDKDSAVASDQPKVWSKPLEKPSRVGENIFKVNDIDEDPRFTQEKRVNTPGVQGIDSKPPLSKQYRPQTVPEKFYTRERELEIEIIDLRKAVTDLESQLDLKQEQIYFYEKREKQSNFAKIEYEALEKAKTQLREAFHKIELYKIETEELIKQVDYTEARVKDLDAENLSLKRDIERREKIAEERLKLTESRTSERTIKEFAKQYELEKEENLRVRKELEIEINKMKSEYLQVESENRELRTKVWNLRDQEEKIKDLHQENYLLSQKLPEQVVGERPKEAITEDIQKELNTQEQLIKGYQKENEKLMAEIRGLKSQMKEDQLRMHHENRKVDLLKSNLIKDHGGILIRENISDIDSINALAGGTVINKEDYLNLKDNLTRLTREIVDKEKAFREKELELCDQVERLKKFKFEAEFMINTLQNSQEAVSVKALENRFENERQSIVGRYEKEIEQLKLRISNISSVQESRIVQQERADDMKRIKMLEEHCRSLEDALKQKETISKLIKAVKPESSDHVDFLIKKVSELESELKRKDSENESRIKEMRPGTVQVTNKRPNKGFSKKSNHQSDPSLVDKIRSLEKQLEDTKNYYISKLNSMRPDESEELKHLREQMINYEKILASMRASAKSKVPDIFPFLSSPSGSTWCQICQEIALLSQNISQKNTRELIKILEEIIETLESTPPTTSCYQSFDKILDLTLSFSSLLKGIPNWSNIEKAYNELCSICNTELSTACRPYEIEAKEEEHEEEYWSDFSDCDQEQEELENLDSLHVIEQIKDGIGYLNRIGGGWLSLDQIQDILCANIPQLNTIDVRGMLRKLKTQQGRLNIDQFLADLRNNNSSWWKQYLFTNSWESKSQISQRGNYHAIAHSKLVPWIIENILEKLENYVNREGIDYEMLAEQVFSGNLAISKRNFRKKVLEHKLPLTREECHIIVQELDRSKIGQITSKVFLNFTRRGPRLAWAPAKSEDLPEYKQLSERDASFLLLQANKRIQELEQQIKTGDCNKVNLSVDHTLALRLKTAEDEMQGLKSKLNYCATENEKLRLDKQRLEIHIEKLPVSIGTSEYLGLQRKLEAIEENHFRREQDLKNRMNGMSFRSEQEIEEIKKKFEIDKNMLQKVIIKKSEEINEFKSELEELLNEIEQLRSKRRLQH